MFPFDSPENIRKPKVYCCFQGDKNGTLGRKVLNKFIISYVIIHKYSKHVYNVVVSYKIIIQWQRSGNLPNMLKILVNRVPWSLLTEVPEKPKYPSTQVPCVSKYPSTLRVPECLKCSSTLGSRVPLVPKCHGCFYCPSVWSSLSARVSWVQKCSSAYRVPTDCSNWTQFFVFVCPNK